MLLVEVVHTEHVPELTNEVTILIKYTQFRFNLY